MLQVLAGPFGTRVLALTLLQCSQFFFQWGILLLQLLDTPVSARVLLARKYASKPLGLLGVR